MIEQSNIHTTAGLTGGLARSGALPKSGNLCHNLGVGARTQPEPPQAKLLWQSALQVVETAGGNDPLQLAQFLDHLAKLYEANGDQAKAARLYERLARVLEPAPPQPEVNRWRLHAWRKLAALQQTQGRANEAEHWLRRALELAESAFRKCSPETAAVQQRLAALLLEQNRLDEAATHYEEALAINESLFGEDHAAVTELCRELSRLEATRGQWAEAEHFAHRALAMRERVLGAAHPALLPELKTLAALQEQLQRPVEAARLYRRAHTIVERRYGAEHYEMAVLWQSLARLSEPAEAEHCYQRALAIKEKLLGVQNLEVAELLEELAQFYLAHGRGLEGEICQRRAASIFERMRDEG